MRRNGEQDIPSRNLTRGAQLDTKHDLDRSVPTEDRRVMAHPKLERAVPNPSSRKKTMYNKTGYLHMTGQVCWWRRVEKEEGKSKGGSDCDGGRKELGNETYMRKSMQTRRKEEEWTGNIDRKKEIQLATY